MITKINNFFKDVFNAMIANRQAQVNRMIKDQRYKAWQ